MQRNHRTRAFIRAAKEDGREKLAAYLLRNHEQGIRYHGHNGEPGDYDATADEEEVLRLLRTGKR